MGTKPETIENIAFIENSFFSASLHLVSAVLHIQTQQWKLELFIAHDLRV